MSWPKPTGKPVASSDPGFTSAETREAIPKKYNAETILTADVKEGEAAKDFALTSGGAFEK